MYPLFMCFKYFGKHKRFYDEIFHFSGDLTLAFCLLLIQRTSISGVDDRQSYNTMLTQDNISV